MADQRLSQEARKKKRGGNELNRILPQRYFFPSCLQLVCSPCKSGTIRIKTYIYSSEKSLSATSMNNFHYNPPLYYYVFCHQQEKALPKEMLAERGEGFQLVILTKTLDINCRVKNVPVLRFLQRV